MGPENRRSGHARAAPGTSDRVFGRRLRAGYLSPVLLVGKTDTVRLAHYGDRPLVFGLEEMLQPNVEDHGDTQQGWQRREQMPALDLGKQRRGKPRVLTKLDQS